MPSAPIAETEAGPQIPELPETTRLQDKSLKHASVLVLLGFFGVQLSNPSYLTKIPFQHLLKDELHLAAAATSVFFLIAGLPWYCKPIAGILTDAFPFFGTRRRHYLLFSIAFTGVCWIGMALLPHRYELLMWAAVFLNCFLVMCSTVLGGFLVESGQRMSATGRLTATRMFATYTAVSVMGPLGGWLADRGLSTAALVSAGLIFMVFPVAYFYLRERPQQGVNLQAIHNAKEQLKAIGKSKMLWWALIFAGLFYFAPGFATPLYYYQKDQLKVSDQFVGVLGMMGGAGMILAALLYAFLARRVSIRLLLIGSIAVAGLAALLYLLYNSPTSALAIDFSYGFCFALAEICLLDLCARSTPKGSEALGFALLVSAINLTGQAADYIGSRLTEAHWTFPNLVLLNAATTLFVLVLIPLLPKELLSNARQLVAFPLLAIELMRC